jgi:hypothetical protein
MFATWQRIAGCCHGSMPLLQQSMPSYQEPDIQRVGLGVYLPAGANLVSPCTYCIFLHVAVASNNLCNSPGLTASGTGRLDSVH